MAKASKRVPPKRLTALPPFDDEQQLTVIIETPKGSRNKYAYDPDAGLFDLKKVLPAGMTFPYDFGFVPSTRGGDQDPLDVLVLMDEPAFAGCRLAARVVGLIEGEQGRKKHFVRNDRVLAVDAENHSYSRVKRPEDLGREFLEELEEFFVNYHQLSGDEFRILAVRGPSGARRCIRQAIHAARRG
jgi:inorganic pyrophosphatase